MIEGVNPEDLNSERAQQENSLSDSAFPTEPFPCPACGQMLAPTVRVCVACKQPIDAAQIRKPEAVAPPAEKQPAPYAPVRARFSWPIFSLVLINWILAAAITQKLWGFVISQLAMGGAVVISSFWVFIDAHQKGVPKPLRWGLGSLLLWVIVFPWYLARRKTPQAPCPLVEAEAGLVARAVFFILIFLVLLGAVNLILKGPPAR